MSTQHYLAVDLGAESGRVMLGTVSPERITLREVHRFANVAVKVPNGRGETWHWDILRLWHEIQEGIAKGTAAEKISGIGVDAWGVDFALLDEHGALLASPVCYRDGRTTGMTERVEARMPKQKLYGITGIQSMFFNTIYQLAALSLNEAPILQQARHLLFTPDLICYWLTGRMANEYTMASTTMMLDARRRGWSEEVLEAIEIRPSLFPEMIFPGTAESLWGQVRERVGVAAGVPVFAVGSHDTASAVVAVPATRKSVEARDWLYISSGTWSLMGAEVEQPVLTEAAFKFNLTNEGGVGGTIRLLKNVAGMWFVQECRRAWAKEGKEYDYATLTALAGEASAHLAAIDPDDPAFEHPGNMPEKIARYCQRTGQRVPGTPGEFVRVILESLAAAYARVRKMLEEATGKTFMQLHIVGGGSQNHLLNQMAADATGLTVVAGPVEATALGNIVAQAITTRQIGSIHEGRAWIAASAEVKIFEPRNE